MTPEAEHMNRNSDDWILAVTRKAQSKHPQVTERVRTTLEQSLSGQLSERKLTSSNLKTIARKLLADQVHQQPELGDTQ